MIKIFSSLKDIEEHIANDEDLCRKLIDFRGGCACFVSPPCGACSNPITEEEAMYFDLFVQQPAPQPDYMKATHDLCR